MAVQPYLNSSISLRLKEPHGLDVNSGNVDFHFADLVDFDPIVEYFPSLLDQAEILLSDG